MSDELETGEDPRLTAWRATQAPRQVDPGGDVDLATEHGGDGEDPRYTAWKAAKTAARHPIGPVAGQTAGPDVFASVRGGQDAPVTPARKPRSAAATALETPNPLLPFPKVVAGTVRGLVRQGGNALAGATRLIESIPSPESLSPDYVPPAHPVPSTRAATIRAAAERLAEALGAPGADAPLQDQVAEGAGHFAAGAIPFVAGGPIVGMGAMGLQAAGQPDENTLQMMGRAARFRAAPGSRRFDLGLTLEDMARDPRLAFAGDLAANLGMEGAVHGVVKAGGGALDQAREFRNRDAISSIADRANAAGRAGRASMEGARLDVPLAEQPPVTGFGGLATEPPRVPIAPMSVATRAANRIRAEAAERTLVRLRAESAARIQSRIAATPPAAEAAAASDAATSVGDQSRSPGNGPVTPAAARADSEAGSARMTSPTEILEGDHAPSRNSSVDVLPSTETSRVGSPSSTTTLTTSTPGPESGTAKLGSIDLTSKKKILQPTSNVKDLLALADRTLPALKSDLSSAVDGLEGATVFGARAKHRNPETGELSESGLARLHQKVEERGGSAHVLSDYVGGRVWVDNTEHAATVVKRLEEKGYQILEDDNFLEGSTKDRAGYRARHMQLVAPSGMSVELQIQPRGVGEVQEPAHLLFNVLRESSVPTGLHQALDAEARRMFALGEEAHKIPHGPIGLHEILEGVGPFPKHTGNLATDAAHALDYNARFESWYRERVGLRPGAPRLPGATGRADVSTIGDRTLRTRYRAVEAEHLIPSNDPFNSFARRADYPQEIQGRVYHGDAGRGARERVVQMAGTLQPEKLTHPSRSTNGPPIVTRRGHVVAGNQRTMGQQLAYAGEGPHGEALRSSVLRDAPLLGLDPAELGAMRQPVIVRELVDPSIHHDDVGQLAELNHLSDIGGGKSKDPRLEAAGRARQIARSPEILEHFANTIAPDETIAEYLRGARGPELLAKMVKGDVIAPQELDAFRDATTGKLTKVGRDKLAEIIQSSAVGGNTEILDAAPPAVLAKLEQGWPKLVAAGEHDGWSLGGVLTDALELHAQRVDNDMASIADVVGQSDMFGRGAAETSPGVVLASFLERSRKAEVTAAFTRYAEAAETARDAAGSTNLFGESPEASDAAFARIFGGERPVASSSSSRRGAVGAGGGEGVRMMSSIAGGGIGGVAGANAGDQGATPEERRRNRLAGAAAGFAAGAALPFAPGLARRGFAKIGDRIAEGLEGLDVLEQHKQQFNGRAPMHGAIGDQPVFHGTPGAPFDAFRAPLEGEGSRSGYANRMLGSFFSTSRRTAAAWATPRGHVLEAELALKNPLHMRGAGDDPIRGMDDLAREHLALEPRMIPGTNTPMGLLPEDHTAWRQSLEAKGHDGIVYEGPTETTVVSFDPKATVRPRGWSGASSSNRSGAIGQQPAKIATPPAPEKAAFDRAGAQIDFSGRLAKKAGGGTRTLGERINHFTDALANQNGPIERLGQLAGSRPSRDPGALLTYVKASDGTAHEALRGAGVLDAITREPVAPSLESIFAPIKHNDADLERAITYLKAKRDVGRGLQGVGGDQAQLDDATTIATYGDANPVLKKIGEQWGQYVDALGQYAVKSGLWTEKQWAGMKASDLLYVRYKRILEESVKPGTGMSSKGFSNVTSGVKKFVGSRRAVSNPIEAMAEYTKQIIHRADRYRVGAAVFDAMDDLGPAADVLATPIRNASAASKATGAIVANAQAGAPTNATQAIQDLFDPTISARNPVLWRNDANGRREFLQIHDKDLWSSLMQLNARDEGAVRAFLDVTVRPLKRIFTATTTGWSPRFSLATNPIRDVPDAMAKSQAGIRPDDIAAGYAHAIANLAGRSDLAKEAQRAGLAGVSIFAQDKPADAARAIAPIGTLNRARVAAGRAVMAPVHAMEAAGAASDLGPRLGEYMAAMRKNLKRVESGEWTLPEARLDASRKGRNVTLDFSNKPANPVLKMFADYVPFFGVGLQGPVQFGQAAARNPGRVGAVLAGAATAAAVAWTLKHRLPEEERQKINDRATSERSGFLYVPTSEGGPILKVPLGQEQGIVVQTVTGILDHIYEQDPNAGQLVLKSLERALPSGMDAMGQGIIPIPGVQQLQENSRNRKVFGDRPVVPRRLEGLPAAERRLDTTRPTFDLAAAAARKLGKPETSPLEAENVIRGVTSSTTPLVTAITDPIASRIMGRRAKATVPSSGARNPLNPASAVLASDPPAATESEAAYYRVKDQIAEGTAEQRRVTAARDRDGRAALVKSYGAVLRPAIAELVKATDERIALVKDRQDAIRHQFQEGQLDADAARTKLDQLTELRQRTLRRAMTTLRAHGVQ